MTADVWFVIDRSTRPQKTGMVTADDRSGTTVRWRDGSTEFIPKLSSQQLKVRADSVAGSFAQSPDDFTERFIKDPLPIFIKALVDSARRDQTKALKAPGLQQAVTPFGPSDEQARAAWNQVQQEVKDHPDVRTANSTYRWMGQLSEPQSEIPQDNEVEIDGFPSNADVAQEPKRSSLHPTFAAEVDANPATSAPSEAAKPEDEPPAPTSPEAPKPEGPSTQPRREATQDSRQPGSPDVDLLALLVRLASNPNKVEAESIIEQIQSENLNPKSGSERALAWALGLRAGQTEVPSAELTLLPDTALRAIASKGQEQDARIVAEVIDVRRESKAAMETLKSLEVEKRSLIFQMLLVRWLEEVERTAPNKMREVITSQSPAVRRFEHVTVSATQELRANVLKLAVALRYQGNDGTGLARSIERVLTGEHTSVAELRKSIETVGISYRKLFEVLGSDDLSPKGYRIAVLSAVANDAESSALQDSKAWTGLTVNSLAQTISHVPRLSEELLRGGDDSIASRTVSQWAKSTGDRSLIAAVLEWPSAMLALLSPSVFQQHLRALRRAQPELDRLFHDEREAQRVAEIEAAAESLAVESRSNEQAAAAAVARVGELQRDLDAARTRIREMQGSSNNVLTSQLRQARIDTVRTLCRILDDVFVAGSSKGGDGLAIWERATSSAAAAGITPIGAPQLAVEFDAEEYEPEDFDAVFAVGQPTFVTRPGYKWIDGQDKIVISRALVVLGAASD